jgi:dTDP-4-amino-4,6-dideoxygalactose transaminase
MTATSVPFLDLRVLHDELRPELDAVWTSALDHSGFIGGEPVERFEVEFAAFCRRAHAIGVANGTDALELVLRGLGIGVGDEVIVPANTFYATAEAVYLVGADPVFIDVEADTLLAPPSAIEAALTSRTAAVIAVHLFGQTVDLDGYRAVADHAGIALIEDAAQAHGARWRQHPAGSVGVAGCFSFYPGKNLGALGDGGAIVTDDPGLAAALRSLANHGRDASTPLGHGRVGRNSRLDALQAGVLSAKLPRLNAWNAHRRRIWGRYAEGLTGSGASPLVVPAGSTSVHHLAVVRVRDRDLVRSRLTDQGIGTGVHYPVPCHRLPPLVPDQHRPLPVAEQAADEILSLPMYPQLTDDQVSRVIEAVIAATREHADVR